MSLFDNYDERLRRIEVLLHTIENNTSSSAYISMLYKIMEQKNLEDFHMRQREYFRPTISYSGKSDQEIKDMVSEEFGLSPLSESDKALKQVKDSADKLGYKLVKK